MTFTVGRIKKRSLVTKYLRLARRAASVHTYVFVSLLQRPRCRTEGQRPKIAMSLALHHVPDLGATQMPAPKIVVPIKKREPDLGFLRVSAGDGIHGNFPDLTERTRELSNVSLNSFAHPGVLPSALKGVAFFLPRQVQSAAPIQLGQRLPAAHLLQSAIWRPPIHPFANTPR